MPASAATALRRRPVRVLLLLAATGLALLAAPAPSRATSWGIADQKASTFAEPAFARLRAAGVRRARLVVPYDAVRYRRLARYAAVWQQADAWLRAARKAGVRPLVTFRSTVRRPAAVRHRVVTARAFLVELRRFRRAYPWVRDFSVWNEPNTNNVFALRPRRLGRLYGYAEPRLRRSCPRCRLLAADLSGRPNVASYAREVRRGAGRPVRYWGLTNYADANGDRDADTRALLRAVHGHVWLTETGGVYSRSRRLERGNHFAGQRRIRFTARRRDALQTRGTIRTLRTVRRFRSRIQRAYVYQLRSAPNPRWRRGERNGSWDSGLLDPRGTPRRSFFLLLRHVR